LVKQYELAKLDEARDAVVIQVMDRAVPPERKSRPKRALIVLMTMATGFTLMLFIILLRERPWTRSEKPSGEESVFTENRKN